MVYALYVFSLPFGPIWALHAFHVSSTGLMLFWYVRYVRPIRCGRPVGKSLPTAAVTTSQQRSNAAVL